MAKSQNKKSWIIPEEICKGQDKMANGEEFNNRMVGAYYGSSLEYNFVCTPQYLNAGDLVAPLYDEVKEVFKPKHPYGTFGALLSDQDEGRYRFESKRAIVQLESVEETAAVADSLDLSTRIIDLVEKLDYITEEGNRMDYETAMDLQASFRGHNDSIQMKIDELVSKSGYAPEFKNGRKVTKKYPDSLLLDIAELAKTKKAITGFNMKIQVVGKHTIAKHDNYVVSGLSSDELELFRRKHNYREKENYSQGTVRLGTIVVPIQSASQVKIVKETLIKYTDTILTNWPDSVKKSRITLEQG